MCIFTSKGFQAEICLDNLVTSNESSQSMVELPFVVELLRRMVATKAAEIGMASNLLQPGPLGIATEPSHHLIFTNRAF